MLGEVMQTTHALEGHKGNNYKNNKDNREDNVAIGKIDGLRVKRMRK